MVTGVDDAVTSQLLSNEALLWSGKPRPGFVFRSTDLFAIPFGLIFLASGVAFWLAIALYPPQGGADQPPPWPVLILFPSVFVLIGGYFAFGRLLWERWVRSVSVYGLTDRRAIIVQHRLHQNVKAISLKDVVDVGLVVGRDGVGTITFNGESTGAGPWAGFAMWGGMWGTFNAAAFELIADARDVYKMVGEAREKSGA